MVDGGAFRGLFGGLISIGIAIGLAIWGLVALVGWIWNGSDDGAIRSTEPIKPEIELIIVDNQVDTMYVYRKPE